MSCAISRREVATYFAAEPNPGVWSVTIRSLSTVFGIPIIFTSLPVKEAYSESLSTVSMESLPPM